MVSKDSPVIAALAAFDISPAAFLVASSSDVSALRATLRGTEHTMTVAPSIDAALRLLDSAEFDVVMLDLDIPAPLAAIRAVRDLTSAPMLGLVSGDANVLELYAAGLDECIQEPAGGDGALVFARAAALLRLRMRPRGGAALFGPDGLTVQLRSRDVRFNDQAIPLAALEFELLEALLRRRGEVLNADKISLAVWGHETFGDRNYVEALVSRLRRKLQRAGARRIGSTVRGVGYTIR